MRVTSAEANKILKQLKNNKDVLKTDEHLSFTYKAAVGENVDELKPDYNFRETQDAIMALDDSIMKLKHAINVFNATTEVIDGMTIDQVLIKLPQLTERAERLRIMSSQPKKQRYTISGNIIDYIYTAYDPDDVLDECNALLGYIDKIQLALDKVNTSVEFDIP